MEYNPCPMHRECPKYDYGSICCMHLYNLCVYKRREDKRKSREEERQKVNDLAAHLSRLSGHDKKDGWR